MEHCTHVPVWHMVRRLVVATTFHPDLTSWLRSKSSTCSMDVWIFDVPEGTSQSDMDCSMGLRWEFANRSICFFKCHPKNFLGKFSGFTLRWPNSIGALYCRVPALGGYGWIFGTQ